MTAIQAAEHEQFCKTIDMLTANFTEVSLSAEKEAIETIYLEYRSLIMQIQQLIVEYRQVRVQARKKIAFHQRKIQRPAKKQVRSVPIT